MMAHSIPRLTLDSGVGSGHRSGSVLLQADVDAFYVASLSDTTLDHLRCGGLSLIIFSL